jgi:hypothetical protein
MNVTGPLIRVLGERFSTDIKVAILETLSTFMSKVNQQMMIIIYFLYEFILGWCST